MSEASKTKDLTPHEVKAALDAKEILLIDVREPDEFAAERIDGAVNVPLSTLDPKALPDADGKTVVMQCAGGKRSKSAARPDRPSTPISRAGWRPGKPRACRPWPAPTRVCLDLACAYSTLSR
jgi:hypothetical protein